MNSGHMVARHDTEAGSALNTEPVGRYARGDRIAAWLRVVAPGMLLTRAIVLLALIVAPSLTAYVYVDMGVRVAAVVLLLAHAASTMSARRRPGAWSTAIVLLLLGIDGLAAGAVLGADPELHGAGLALTAGALAMGFETGGWGAAFFCAGAVVLGGAAASWFGGGTPLVFSPRLVFPTTLSVETQFAGVSATVTGAPSFSTTLSVETAFAGALALTPPPYWPATLLSLETAFAGVSAIASTQALSVPTLVLVLCALCIGGGVSLLGARADASAPETRAVIPA